MMMSLQGSFSLWVCVILTLKCVIVDVLAGLIQFVGLVYCNMKCVTVNVLAGLNQFVGLCHPVP